MVSIKAKVARSWLTAASLGVAAQFRERLLRRCEGESEGRFITLTYRRVEGETPADLYRRAREERHVRLFVRKLQKKLNWNLTGRWLCKMEFQQGGWVHWHLLVLGLGFVDNREVEKWWGHGCVDVKRMTEANIRYISKYVAKGGEIPQFLHLERARSVRVVRVSPGFWQDVEPPADSYAGKPEPIAWSHVVDEETGELTEVPVTGPLPWYRAVGQMIEDAESGVVMRDERGGFGRVRRAAGEVLAALWKAGVHPTGGEDGWLHFDSVTMDDVHGVVVAAAAAADQRSQTPPRSGGLDLIRSPHPHNEGWQTPRWLEWFLTWDYGWLDEPDVSGGSVEGLADLEE